MAQASTADFVSAAAMSLHNCIAPVLAAAAAVVSLQGCADPFQPKCNAGPVGTCGHFGCYPTRGPTSCIGNSCMCLSGYCQYGTNFLRCRAEVPDVSCDIVPVCYSSGVASSSCVDGHCLCRSNMHIGSGGACVSGWWPDKPTEFAANMTAEEVEAMAAADAQEDREIALNVVLAVLSVVAPTTALMAIMAAVVRMVHNSRVSVADESDEGKSKHYQRLLGSTPA